MSAPLARTNRGRNYGVDALRCLAMLLIVCLHVMYRGSALPPLGTPAAIWLYPLRVLASAAVNIYALISGYVMLNGRFRPARVLELWLQVWVLNVVIGLTGDAIDPEAMDTEFWVRYLFPFTQKAYWYFTAYVGVYAFSPLLNRGIRGLNRAQAISMIWLMLLLFSLCTTLGYVNQGDPFCIGAGYSVLWLTALYVVGACIRSSGFLRTTPTRRLLAVLALLVLLCTGLFWLAHRAGAPAPLRVFEKRLLDYTNPLIAAVAVLMLLLFSRLRPGARLGRLIAFFSPLSFGVYVIHVHHVFWMPMNGAFAFLSRLPGLLIPFGVLLTALAVFLAAAGIDWLRAGLFRLLRVKGFLDLLEAALRRWITRIIKETNGNNNG